MWFQQEFEQTSSQSGMNLLMQQLDNKIDNLADKYGRKDVIHIIVDIARTDKRLRHPVPEIILNKFTQPLQFTIKSDKKVYEVGEEIKIIVTVTNIGNEPEHISTQGPKFYAPDYRLAVDGDYGQSMVAPFAADPKRQTTVLQPNQQYKLTVKCGSPESQLSDYGSIFPSLLHPGKHTISACYQKPSVKSNTITIEVMGKEGISKAGILKIAQIICKGSGWEWNNINIYDENNRWHIVTKSLQNGDKIRIFIDKYTGEVLNVFYNFE